MIRVDWFISIFFQFDVSNRKYERFKWNWITKWTRFAIFSIIFAKKFQCFHMCSCVIETEKKHSIFVPVHVHIWKNASDTYSLRLSHVLFIKCDIAEKFNVNKSMQCQSIDFLFQYSGKWDMHFSWFSAFGLSRANSRKFFLSIDFI